jgi:pilus assembly protein CpaF
MEVEGDDVIESHLEGLEDRLHRLTSEFIQAHSKSDLERVSLGEDRKALSGIVENLLQREGEILPRRMEKELVEAVVNRIVGFGPIEPYLHDPQVTEIMVNAPEEVFVERNGEIEPVQASFRDEEHILNVIDRIVAPLGRRVDESVPFVDARLPDGSRVNAIIPPLALGSPALTIRRFSATPFTLTRLVDLETLTEDMA